MHFNCHSRAFYQLYFSFFIGFLTHSEEPQITHNLRLSCIIGHLLCIYILALHSYNEVYLKAGTMPSASLTPLPPFL